MKKFIMIIAVVVMVALSSILLVGCGEDMSEYLSDLKALNDRIEELEDLDIKHTEDIDALTLRIEKLESIVGAIDTLTARVSAIEESSNNDKIDLAKKYSELTESLNVVKSDLLANSVADELIKTKVTSMQTMLDTIQQTLATKADAEALSVTQASLDKLYGATYHADYSMDDVVPMGRNGLVYYSVRVQGEYHWGNVGTYDGKPRKCYGNSKHWCGKMTIDNHNGTEISSDEVDNIIWAKAGNNHSYSSGYIIRVIDKNGAGMVPPTIKTGEVKEVYFCLNIPDQTYVKSLDIMFMLPRDPGVIPRARMKGFWDISIPPIMGENPQGL